MLKIYILEFTYQYHLAWKAIKRWWWWCKFKNVIV